jgi:hypothetical protein
MNIGRTVGNTVNSMFKGLGYLPERRVDQLVEYEAVQASTKASQEASGEVQIAVESIARPLKN